MSTDGSPVAAIAGAGITKSFGGHRALAGVDLEVPQGQILVLLGASGCGKTTLLRVVAGFERADSGTVHIGGDCVCGPGLWTPPEKRRVGMVFQDYALFPHLTVEQNVGFGLHGRDGRARRVAELLAGVGLSGLGPRYPYQLSGGQQQRVAVARALAADPAVLLLDEPFSNLDAALRRAVRTELRALLRGSRATAVFVTHDQEEAMSLGDLVAVMNDGRVEQAGPPEDLYLRPDTRFVAEFVGSADFLPGQVQGDHVRTVCGDLRFAGRCAAAGEIDVLVRPDDWRVQEDSAGNGVVADRSFHGTHTMYEVSLSGGLRIRVMAARRSAYRTGTAVQVRLAPGHPLRAFVGSQAYDLQPDET